MGRAGRVSRASRAGRAGMAHIMHDGHSTCVKVDASVSSAPLDCAYLFISKTVRSHGMQSLPQCTTIFAPGQRRCYRGATEVLQRCWLGLKGSACVRPGPAPRQKGASPPHIAWACDDPRAGPRSHIPRGLLFETSLRHLYAGRSRRADRSSHGRNRSHR